MFKPGDVVVLNFPGVTGTKRRPSVVVSSSVYHASRPDVIVGLITSQIATLGYGLCIARLVAGWLEDSLSFSQFFRYFTLRYPSYACRPSI